MSYVDDNITEGERIVYRTEVHWAIYSGSIISFVLGLFGWIYPSVQFIFWFTLLAPFFAFAAFLKRRTSEFALTSQRVLIKVGVFHRRTVDIFLTKLESISVDQSVGGQIFGYGDLIIVGSGGTKEIFKTVNNAFEFRKKVQEASIQAHKTLSPEKT